MSLNLSKIIDFVRQNQDQEADEKPTVLIVDDEESVADLYSKRLERSQDYEVRTAYGGKESLELIEGVDVVLLDRRMPDMSGDEVLEEIRERGNGCQVVMVTAVEPDIDIIEMGFDHYVVKPVDEEGLYQTVEYALARRSLDEKQQEYHSLRQKRDLLREELEEWEIEEHGEYKELERRIDELEQEIGDLEKVIEFYYSD